MTLEARRQTPVNLDLGAVSTVQGGAALQLPLCRDADQTIKLLPGFAPVRTTIELATRQVRTRAPKRIWTVEVPETDVRETTGRTRR
jgi:hypothetical protein